MDTAPADPFLRYGLADLIVEELDGAVHAAFERSDDALTEAAYHRVDALEGKVRAYLQETPDGFEGVPVDHLDGDQSKETGYQVRAHVLRPEQEIHQYRRYLFPAAENMTGFAGRAKVFQRNHPHVSKLTVKTTKKGVDNVKRGGEHALLGTIATLTPNKVARWTESQGRVAVIPDLSLEDMVSYIRLARRLIDGGPGLAVRIRQNDTPTLEELGGNYYATPPAWAFGTLSLLGAAGELARRFDWEERYRRLAKKIATSRTYLVGAEGTTVEPKAGHVWDLARQGLLEAVSAAGKAQLANDSDAEEEVFKLFLRRWLLLYTQTRFEEFLSVRGTYPQAFEPILDHYHMRDSSLDDELLDAAKAMANFVSKQCFFAAQDADGDTDQVAQQNLASMESLIEDASDTSELAGRLIVSAGRLAGNSLPPEAEPFLDALHDGSRVGLKKASNMLLSYMRLRQPNTGDGDSGSGDVDDDLGEEHEEEGTGVETDTDVETDEDDDLTGTESFHDEVTQ
jgi:hypothetical protein